MISFRREVLDLVRDSSGLVKQGSDPLERSRSDTKEPRKERPSVARRAQQHQPLACRHCAVITTHVCLCWRCIVLAGWLAGWLPPPRVGMSLHL